MNSTETNRRIAEQFNEAFNRGDLDAAASCFSEDCRNHGRKVGRDGVRTVLGEIKTNFPDARLTTLTSVSGGERANSEGRPILRLNWYSQLSLEPNRATNRKALAVRIS